MITIDAFAHREIIYCVSHLVSEIASKEIDYWPNLAYQKDWETPADYHVHNRMNEAELREFLSYKDENHEHIKSSDIHLLRRLVWLLLEPNEYEDFCNEHDLEDAYTEIYEYWIVSDYLAEKLERHGEVIEKDFYGLTIWGRTCTGQSITMDSVIQKIFKEFSND